MEGSTLPFSIGKALRFGWSTTKNHLKPLLLIGAAGAFLAVLNEALSRPRAHSLLMLLVQALQACVTLVYLRAALRLHDGLPVDLSRPGELLRGFFPFLLTSILEALIVVAGLVLLIVPGVVWGLQFSCATLVSADKQLDPIACLRESNRLTRGVKGRLLGFGVAALGLNLLGCLAFGVGLLFTLPTTVLAWVSIYRRLQLRAPSEAGPQLPLPLPPLPAASH